jgi:hypothetical protein
MIANAEVEQLMHDDEVLKALVLSRKIMSERHNAGARARAPFARHTLNPHEARNGPQPR